MNDLEAISQRYSRRSYLSIPIEILKLNVIENILYYVNRQSGLNFELIEDCEYAFNSFVKGCSIFQGVRTIILLKGDKFDVDLREKAGYYGEKVVLELIKEGLGTCFISSNYIKRNIEFNIQNDEDVVGIITVGYVSESRSFMEDIMFRAVNSEPKNIKTLLCADKSFPLWLENGIKAVQIAPTTLNCKNVKFEYLRDILTIYVLEETDENLIELGKTKLHFEIATGGEFEIGNYATFFYDRVKAID